MSAFDNLAIETPAFIIDESRLIKMAKLLAHARTQSGCRMLYSIKALPFSPVLALIAPWLDGFAVSSLFEARLAAEMGLPLHITTPGLRAAEIGEIGQLCSAVAFNSLQQFHRLLPALGNQASPGLRINPGRSFQLDPRFDPCRPASKLGIPLAELVQALAEDSTLTNNIKGLHFHTVFASHNFAPMRDAVERLEQALGAAFLNRLEWINLGGGYLFECKEDLAGLVEIAGGLKHRFGVEVYFEPGKAIVGQAGYLAATVLDCFRRDGHLVAVLDTTVNHHPEIFEYQIRPQPAWAEPEQGETVLLAGCTCLAGDVFGEYRFDRPVQVGDRMVFANVGAYSLIKANRFNGYNLPSIYAWDGGLTCRLLQRFNYSDYRRLWVADDLRQTIYD